MEVSLAWAVAGSGFGDVSPEAGEGDVLRLGAAASAGLEAVESCDVSLAERELETSMFSAMRVGLVDFGMRERPCWRPQRSLT